MNQELTTISLGTTEYMSDLIHSKSDVLTRKQNILQHEILKTDQKCTYNLCQMLAGLHEKKEHKYFSESNNRVRGEKEKGEKKYLMDVSQVTLEQIWAC